MTIKKEGGSISPQDGVLQAVSQSYDIGNIVRTQPAESGFMTENFYIFTPNGRFFLKQYRANPERVTQIHNAITFFTESGIPTNKSLTSSENKPFIQVGNWQYALFPFVDGSQLAPSEISDGGLISAASTLAEIHLATADNIIRFDINGITGWEREDFISQAQALLSSISAKPDLTDFDRLSIEGLKLKLKLAQRNHLKFEDLKLGSPHLLHGDYHAANIFFDEEQRVKHVFDFEMASSGPRITEVLRSLNFICFDGDYSDEGFRKATLYLRAYHEKYPLTMAELRAGILNYYLMNVHYLWIEKAHYIDSNNRVDHFLPYQIADTRQFSENLEDIITKLSFALK